VHEIEGQVESPQQLQVKTNLIKFVNQTSRFTNNLVRAQDNDFNYSLILLKALFGQN